MGKKKEQVKLLKEEFAAVVKAFEKEKNKKKRNEIFTFLSGRIAEFREYQRLEMDLVAFDPGKIPKVLDQSASHIAPSPELVEEIRAERMHKQN